MSVELELKSLQATVTEMRGELRTDISEIFKKLDESMNEHNQLKLEFAKYTGIRDEQVSTIRMILDKHESEIKTLREAMTKAFGLINSHIETSQAVRETRDESKRRAVDWVRWAPAIIVAIIGLVFTVANFVRG